MACFPQPLSALLSLIRRHWQRLSSRNAACYSARASKSPRDGIAAVFGVWVFPKRRNHLTDGSKNRWRRN